MTIIRIYRGIGLCLTCTISSSTFFQLPGSTNLDVCQSTSVHHPQCSTLRTEQQGCAITWNHGEELEAFKCKEVKEPLFALYSLSGQPTDESIRKFGEIGRHNPHRDGRSNQPRQKEHVSTVIANPANMGSCRHQGDSNKAVPSINTQDTLFW